MVLPAVNAEAMQVFLDHVAASRPPDAHLVMVLDGAGWHLSRALAVPANITLAVLAPYSPELNPVERVWLSLRERFLSLRLLPSTDAIIDACCDAWMRLVAEQDRLRSLCAYPWIENVVPWARWYERVYRKLVYRGAGRFSMSEQAAMVMSFCEAWTRNSWSLERRR